MKSSAEQLLQRPLAIGTVRKIVPQLLGAFGLVLFLKYRMANAIGETPWELISIIFFVAAFLAGRRLFGTTMLAVGVCIALLDFFGLERGYSQKYVPKTQESPRVNQLTIPPYLSIGAVAPETIGTDLNGQRMELSDFRGKVTMLVFWASWCGPCMAEVPQEKALLDRYRGRPFEIVGVNCDVSIEEANAAVKKLTIPWRSFSTVSEAGVMEHHLVKLWEVSALPTVYLIDDQGHIRHHDLSSFPGSQHGRIVEGLVAEAESR